MQFVEIKQIVVIRFGLLIMHCFLKRRCISTGRFVVVKQCTLLMHFPILGRCVLICQLAVIRQAALAVPRMLNADIHCNGGPLNASMGTTTPFFFFLSPRQAMKHIFRDNYQNRNEIFARPP